VTTHEFPFTYTPPAALEQLTPVLGNYDTGAYTGSGTGNVTGNVIPVDIVLTPPRDPVTSGCEAADFAALDFSGPNDIALIQRGTCPFGQKATNAEAAGAEAVIIFNQGNTPDREGLIIGTLVPSVVTIPVVGASFDDGAALAVAGSTAHVQIDAPSERPQINVLAELPGRNKNNVVMAGAHLDSVQRGPGINDNGSGSAALLELGQQLSNHKPENTLRFAWWGAEESGLLGSAAYVQTRSPAELERIALYLNFDMIGSPNYVFMVYDGDESGFPAPVGVPIPEGSIQIEDVFESFYTYKNEPYDDAQFSGRSDYEEFILNGIPAGGLFTGAEVVKTPAQAALWGGTAGEQFDPCYHEACDTYQNNSNHALDVNSDAIAFAVLTYAYSTESVNGVKGKKVPGNFTIPLPAGPEGTGAGGGFKEHPGD
jgi:Zn-dependent M28 family amino/carboxypeptidase